MVDKTSGRQKSTLGLMKKKMPGLKYKLKTVDSLFQTEDKKKRRQSQGIVVDTNLEYSSGESVYGGKGKSFYDQPLAD